MSVTKQCAICSAEMRVKASHAERRKCCGIECSREWRRLKMSGEGNHQYGVRGEANASWRGGRRKSFYGYVLVVAHDHPDANVDGCVFEHRLVMEQHVGRRLLRGEVVHHRNGDKMDNRIENLELMSLGEHSAEHRREAPMPRDAVTGRFVPNGSRTGR